MPFSSAVSFLYALFHTIIKKQKWKNSNQHNCQRECQTEYTAMSMLNCNKDCVYDVIDPRAQNTETLTNRKWGNVLFSKENMATSESICKRGKQPIALRINKTEQSTDSYQRMKNNEHRKETANRQHSVQKTGKENNPPTTHATPLVHSIQQMLHSILREQQSGYKLHRYVLRMVIRGHQYNDILIY